MPHFERYPGKRWIATWSQQGWRKGSKHITAGPIQFNWNVTPLLYITWPIPFVVCNADKVVFEEA